MKKYTITILIWTITIALTACLGQENGKSETKTTVTDSISFISHYSDTAQTDSTKKRNEDLAKIYCQAISDYITEVYKRDRTVSDTLFFGKRNNGQPDDFPDIVLSETINNIKIRLIDPEVGKKLQEEKKSRVYINLIGWVDKDKAEFIFVTFSNGFEHKFDCYIDYKYDAKQEDFVFEKSRIERFKK